MNAKQRRILGRRVNRAVDSELIAERRVHAETQQWARDEWSKAQSQIETWRNEIHDFRTAMFNQDRRNKIFKWREEYDPVMRAHKLTLVAIVGTEMFCCDYAIVDFMLEQCRDVHDFILMIKERICREMANELVKEAMKAPTEARKHVRIRAALASP